MALDFPDSPVNGDYYNGFVMTALRELGKSGDLAPST